MFVTVTTILICMTNIIYINDEGKTRLFISLNKNVKDVISTSNINLERFDTYTLENRGFNVSTLSINRGNKITAYADGKEYIIYSKDGLLKDILKENEFSVGDDDITTVSLDTMVNDDISLNIHRVSYVTRNETKSIPYETDVEYSPLLRHGKTKVITDGKDGIITTTYVDKVIDGEIVETKKQSETTTSEPTSAKVLTGNKDKIISPLSFGGNKVLIKKGAVATAYSARDGAKTASGRYAKVGHIAVNPKEIPYGTKLYITSSDGDFVYGYAVAADTGSFVNTTNVDVDLFFDSYLESKLFGKQAVDIYMVR